MHEIGVFMEEKGIRMIIAGGGTGGHLFPAIAIAEEFLGRSPMNEVLFMGTDKGLEARLLQGLGFALRTIKVAGIKGRGLKGMAVGVMKIPRAVAQSISILRNFHPDIALGVGGYASGPALIAAICMGIRTAVAEQNSVPGFTNRVLGRFVNRVFLTFPDGEGRFAAAKTIVAGNPVRKSFMADLSCAGKKEDIFSILVFGGSQGARSINRAVVEAIPYMEDIRNRLFITHQTGEGDLEEVKRAYRDLGIAADVQPFIADMASAYASADLLICRAGATSIAEITAVGRAAILIPYPFAAGGHQELNAKVLADAGAAEMIIEKDLSGEALAGEIRRLFDRPDSIGIMEKRSKSLGNINAAEKIVDECIKLLKLKP